MSVTSPVRDRLRRRPPARAEAPRPSIDAPRAYVTPEGVDLRLRIGSYGERFSAFAIDAAILLGILIGFTLILALTAWITKLSWAGELLAVVWLLGSFVLRNFYFMALELGPRAATPGKRIMGLRVIDAGGGRLTADAVFARNAMREVEVIMPLTFFLARGQGIDAALIGLGAIWSGVFVVFPLFNRDRRRLGDLAAGTLVVKAPRRVLEPDLAGVAAGPAALGFTPEQLDAYGVKELHVLESVLRANDRRSIAEVARRIRGKIGWEGPTDIADRTFLEAYYAGLRGRLEGGLLFGRRRADKFDRG